MKTKGLGLNPFPSTDGRPFGGRRRALRRGLHRGESVRGLVRERLLGRFGGETSWPPNPPRPPLRLACRADVVHGSHKHVFRPEEQRWDCSAIYSRRFIYCPVGENTGHRAMAARTESSVFDEHKLNRSLFTCLRALASLALSRTSHIDWPVPARPSRALLRQHPQAGRRRGGGRVRPRRPQGGFGGSPPDSPRFCPLLPQTPPSSPSCDPLPPQTRSRLCSSELRNQLFVHAGELRS